jgi:hypothetical protein
VLSFGYKPIEFFAPRENRRVARCRANEAFLGLTKISKCQYVGDADVNYPKLAIQKKGAKNRKLSAAMILPSEPVLAHFLPSI